MFQNITKENNNGITLVALIITIIILIILAAVTIMTVYDSNFIGMAMNGTQNYAQEQYREMDMINSLNSKLEETTKAIEDITSGNVATGNNPGESIIGAISKITTSGVNKVTVEGKTNKDAEIETVEYGLDVIVHKGNLVLDGVSEVEGATLTDRVYEFGNEADVGTETEDAKNTVVLRVDGNLTIKENVTLSTVNSSLGYGGPKGLIIYCTGNIENKGTISMTARGAKAGGQNVYLWTNKSAESSVNEYIPATGAAGGEKVSTSAVEYHLDGNNGESGINRQTGGGGSGSVRPGDEYPTVISGAGAAGTSYSGGTGGGGTGANTNRGTNSGNPGNLNGGAGGYGSGIRPAGWRFRAAGGGAGNPGGNGGYNGVNNTTDGKGENGTGGLLVIFTRSLNNTGKIESNGSKGGVLDNVEGGSSGGGSINIFYREKLSQNGTVEANGGAKARDDMYGSEGGTGAISIGKIVNGSYISGFKNY